MFFLPEKTEIYWYGGTPPHPSVFSFEGFPKHDIDYTHMHTDFRSTSIIDHFVMNEQLLSLIADCRPLHLGDIRSRHIPILVKLNLGAISAKQEFLMKTPRRPTCLVQG